MLFYYYEKKNKTPIFNSVISRPLTQMRGHSFNVPFVFTKKHLNLTRNFSSIAYTVNQNIFCLKKNKILENMQKKNYRKKKKNPKNTYMQKKLENNNLSPNSLELFVKLRKFLEFSKK